MKITEIIFASHNAGKIAEIKEISYKEVCEKTKLNAKNLFNIK